MSELDLMKTINTIENQSNVITNPFDRVVEAQLPGDDGDVSGQVPQDVVSRHWVDKEIKFCLW